MTTNTDAAREAARFIVEQTFKNPTYDGDPSIADLAIDTYLAKALEGADEKLVEARTRSIQLRQMAKSASEASKFLAADKQARNRAAGDESATYNGLEVSETREWRSAEAIDELLTLVTALSAEKESLRAEYKAIYDRCDKLESQLTAQKAAHAKMMRDRAAEWDTWGTSRIDHKTIATEYRRLADKIEGEP